MRANVEHNSVGDKIEAPLPAERERNKLLRKTLTATCDDGTCRLASEIEKEKKRKRKAKI